MKKLLEKTDYILACYIIMIFVAIIIAINQIF